MPTLLPSDTRIFKGTVILAYQIEDMSRYNIIDPSILFRIVSATILTTMTSHSKCLLLYCCLVCVRQGSNSSSGFTFMSGVVIL